MKITSRNRWRDFKPLKVHEFAIHCEGHLSVYLPEDKILLAADMLEDSIWIFEFNFAAPETQLAEFDKMMAISIDRIYASHFSLATVNPLVA